MTMMPTVTAPRSLPLAVRIARVDGVFYHAPMSKRTTAPDYSRIAPMYDRAREWTAIRSDEVVAELVPARSDRKLRALEVGCGTGNYLKAQVENGPSSVSWTGIDSSRNMLVRAQAKLRNVRLVFGAVEALPFDDGAFDYVICRASFHHFSDKELALRELRRVIRGDGWLRIWGGHPEARRRWWVYRYFPETVAIDESRFWGADRLFETLQAAGFEVQVRTESNLRMVATKSLQERARLRDLSQLALIDEEAYATGLSSLSSEPADRVVDESGIVDLRARRLD